MMFETWTPAVFSLMNSSSAICRFVRPRATRPRTSRSRAVSPSAATAGSSRVAAVRGDRRARVERVERESAHAPRAPSLRAQAGRHRAAAAVSSDARSADAGEIAAAARLEKGLGLAPAARRPRRTGARAVPRPHRAAQVSGSGRWWSRVASASHSRSHAADSVRVGRPLPQDVGVPRPDRLEETVDRRRQRRRASVRRPASTRDLGGVGVRPEADGIGLADADLR